jgi:hypothetical protein
MVNVPTGRRNCQSSDARTSFSPSRASIRSIALAGSACAGAYSANQWPVKFTAHSSVHNNLVAGSSPARAHHAWPCRLRVARPSGNRSAKRGVRHSSNEARAKTDGRRGPRFATGRICRIPALTVRGNSESLSLGADFSDPLLAGPVSRGHFQKERLPEVVRLLLPGNMRARGTTHYGACIS